jgi:hypothetical protein
MRMQTGEISAEGHSEARHRRTVSRVVVGGAGPRVRGTRLRRRPGLAEAHGGVEQQRVDERLRDVAAQLALADVVLLGAQPRRSAQG